MERLKHHWRRVHPSIRRPVVFIVGSLFLLASALTGWLPGPGGLPLFLIGIAILATEFEKAARFRDWILTYLHRLGHWGRQHRLLGSLLLAAGLGLAIMISLLSWQHFHAR